MDLNADVSTGTIVVTGAGGFVGAFLCRELAARGVAVRAIVRRAPEHAPRGVVYAVAGDLESADASLLARSLEGARGVVHLAGRAHVLDERARDPMAAYDLANRAATERVAAAAVEAGVERFVFASTVKVNGESTAPGRPFRPGDPPAPRDDYARSKLAAEHALAARCAASRTTPLILRLPLVYGPGVRGNFLRLLDAVGAEKRLPVGAIDNRRSLLYVGNLADAIIRALDRARPLTGVHFVADAGSVSTPELVRSLAAAMKETPRLVAVPVGLLRAAARIVGRTGEIERLAQSLEVDTRSFTEAADWMPRFTLAEGLAATAAWWRVRHSI